ncbi:hypothetical protein KP77_19890 [Jeotgalibacillus alimentarius]|uniref:DUF3899 domain-containing protein n=1 Tax=Jeotgalibacillus alimentarius TaxID=135826 RepID=A0A0C2VXS4_9BACL|nr:hypothetical protein [Jeotgalibacillus alimentarius]KIL48778.1 hypothetical protein KP77_19890 [Jeotgalibacillus alimentarius]
MIKFLNLAITAISIILVNVVFMFILNAGFIEVSFFAGIVSIVVIRFFTSPGNYAKANRQPTQSSLSTVQFGDKTKYLYPKLIEGTSLVYTALSLATIFAAYYEYLI